MAKDFKKKLQELLFPRQPNDNSHELAISPDDVVIGTGTVKELNSDNPLQFRLDKLKEITGIVARKRLEEHAVEAIWVAIQDLVQPTNPLELRVVALTFLKALIQGQYDHLQLLRDHFFHVVATHNIEEDFGYRLDILIELTRRGRNVTCFEEEIGPLLLNWMPVMSSHERLCDFLNLLVNIIHYNSTYLDDHVISGLVQYSCAICDRFEPVAAVLKACLSVFDSVLRYSCLPVNALRPLIVTLCLSVNREAVCHTSWQLVSNLLGTHLGDKGIYILCCILEEEGSDENALLLQGAVYFLGMSLWGARRVPSLRHSYPSVLPSIVKALRCGRMPVVYEVVCSVDRLVRKYGQSLDFVTWDLVTDILEKVATHVESETSLEDGSRVAQCLHHVCCCIEDLCDNRKCFTGSPERFFSLVEKLTLKRPESCALALVLFRAESIVITSPDWMEKLCSLMENYYRNETRTNIRLQALAVLSSVLSSCRYTFEDEIIEVVVLPYMLSVYKDSDMTVRTAVTQLLVDLAYDCHTPHFCNIVNAINKVANREIGESKEHGSDAHSEGGGENGGIDDIQTAVVGLIGLFKWKLFHLPSAHCFCVYQSLIDHVYLHYQRQNFTQQTASIRLKVLKCLLQLRSDNYHHLGLVDDNSKTVFGCFVMCNGTLIDATEDKRSRKLSPLRPTPSASPTAVAHSHSPLNFVAAFDLTLMCLQQELDKTVVTNVLEMLATALCDHTLILSCGVDLSTLCQMLCRMASRQSLSDSSVGRQCRFEVPQFVYPVLTVLATYPRQLERKHKHDLIKCIESGIRSRYPHMCIVSLSLCCMEMPNVMARLLPSVLSTLSQLSATVALSLPVLEFLSNLSCLDDLCKGFHESQYRAIFAMALPYTDPTKFPIQVISLAYHVIFTWFVRTPITHRKVLVKFISKALPGAAGSLPLSQHRHSDMHSSQTSVRSLKLSRQSVDGGGLDGGGGTQHDEKAERGAGGVVSVGWFYEEMREVCLDLMARYTYSNCFTQPSRSALASSLISGGQMKHWLVGNTVVTITTVATQKSTAVIGSTQGVTPGLSRENSAASSSQPSPVRSTHLFFGGDSWQSADISQCQGWAELLVRRPTGNMAWMMKMENKPEHCRKSLPIPLFASSTSVLHQDDLSGLWCPSGSGYSGFVPPSPLVSSGMSLRPLRQRTPVSLLSPVQQTQPASDMNLEYLTQDIGFSTSSVESEGKVFHSDSSDVRHLQQKESTPTSIPGRRTRRQLDFPRPCLGVSPLDHELAVGDSHYHPGILTAAVDNLRSPPARDTKPTVETAGISSEGPNMRHSVGDSTALPCHLKLHRYDSCPQLQTKDASLLSHQFYRQQSREAEDVLLSPTSPEIDETLLVPATAGVLHSVFPPGPQRRLSAASSVDDSLDPSFLFLQLYGQVFARAEDGSQPVLLPKTDCVQRSLKVVDHLQPYNTHKIGVVYIGKGQHVETSILSNEYGSLHYCQFLSGLGKLISLRECRASDVYLGGLSQTGEDGQFTYVWTNEISQVVFHVATLMTNKRNDPQCHSKKRHIGNDFVKIVFNESGEEYQPDTIKAQFNLVDIVIDAICEGSFRVTLHTKPGIPPPIADVSPRIISDECLPLLVRQMAYHADLSCMAHHSEQAVGDHTLTNWMERLRKIKHLCSKVSSDGGNDVVFTDYT